MNFNIKQNVEGVNLLNKAIVKELETILPQLKNYIGKRILTQSGRSAKFIINHSETKNFRQWFDISTYSIWINCDICTLGAPDKNGVCVASYFKKQIYLGKMKATGELEELETLEKICTNWKLNETIEESKVMEMKNRYKEIEAELSKIKSEFPLDTDLLKY